MQYAKGAITKESLQQDNKIKFVETGQTMKEWRRHMDYKTLAKEILKNVGGADNVAAVTHCATRLRFNLKDDTKARTDELKKVKGVMGVVNKGGQYQVVIGSDVVSVYKPLLELGNFDSGDSGNGSEASDEKKKNPIVRVLDTVAGIFTPIIPAITGAGMLKAVLALLVTFKWIDTEAQTYVILNLMADAAFNFLPFLIANSAAKKFKCNPYMAMSIAGVLLHPTFISMVNAAKATEGGSISFLGMPVTLASYASSVIPIILGVWFMSFVEPLADKVSPKAVKFFIKPLLTLLITAPVTFLLLGPLGNIIGEGIAFGIQTLDSYASWLVPLIVGTFTPLMVMTGMHYGLIPIGINNIATTQFDTVVGPGMLGSNIAQGGASLAVAVRTKDRDLKQLASSAGITAVCGITEPAMYGVSLKYKTPLYAAMIGGGISGLFLGITKVGRYTSGSPGLLALPGYIGTDGFRNITFAVIGAVIAFAVSFLVSFLLFKDPVKTAEADQDAKTAGSGEENKAAGQKQLNSPEYGSATEQKIASPVAGTAIRLSEVSDPTFAEGILGDGAAVIPGSGIFHAPADGEILTVFDTKHAIGFRTRQGIELLIHVGIDTVRLNGEGFKTYVKEGDLVHRGDVLMEVDLELLQKKGYEITTPVIITNTAECTSIAQVTSGKIAAGDTLLQIVK